MFDPCSLVAEAALLVRDDGEPRPAVEPEEEDLERVGVDLADGRAPARGTPTRPEGLERVVGQQRAGEGGEARVARRAVGRGVEAAESARDLIVAAAAAMTQPEERSEERRVGKECRL